MSQPTTDPPTRSSQETLKQSEEGILTGLVKAAPNPDLVSNQPDLLTRQERQDLDTEERRTKIHGLEQDIQERKRYALYSFLLVCCWLLVVLWLVFLQGLGSAGTEIFWHGVTWKFKLSDPVVLALIGATTLNVIGLFVVVVKYLFPQAAAQEAAVRAVAKEQDKN